MNGVMKKRHNVFTLRTLQHVFAVALLMTMAGCAGHKRPVTTIDFQKVKTVGLYSSCASQLYRVRHPAFNFGSRDIDVLNIKSWKLDDHILDVVQKNTVPSITYKVMDLNEDLVREAYERAYTRDGDGLAWNVIFENAPPYDLYIVFLPGRGNVGTGDGFGVYSRLGMGFTYQLCIANVYDPNTQSIIRRYGYFSQKYASREYREDTWKEYSDEQLLKVRERMTIGADELSRKISKDFISDPNNINGPRP